MTADHPIAPPAADAATGVTTRLFSAPLAAVGGGHLVFERGASLVTLGAGAPRGELFEARCEGPAPRVQAAGGVVTVRYRRLSLQEWARYALLWGRHATTIRLSAERPWQVSVRGGVSRLSGDLRELRLLGLTVEGGASDVLLDLPEPAGVVRLRFEGGVSRLTLRRPASAPAVLRVAGGVSQLSFDTQYSGAIGGGVRLETPGAGAAPRRYEVEVAGGASRLSLDTW